MMARGGGSTQSRSIGRLALTVWRRNLDVYRKTYKTALVPPLLEPLLYLFAFGFGLGAIVSRDVGGVSYIQFIAPAMIGISVMNGASFECTYASFVRMYYQKTFDAIIATPVSVEEVITGEILWGATKSLVNATLMVIIMLIVSPILHVTLLSPYYVVLIPFCAFIGGFAFSSIAMCFTAVVPLIDHFNYYIFLVITPMMLLSGTFFPLEALPAAIETIAQSFPLTHLVRAIRELAFGAPTAATPLSLLTLGAFIALFFPLALRLMRRRLVD